MSEISERDCDVSAFPTEDQFWPNCGLTKMQWASALIAASIAPSMLHSDEQAIADKAAAIAMAVLERSAP